MPAVGEEEVQGSMEEVEEVELEKVEDREDTETEEEREEDLEEDLEDADDTEEAGRQQCVPAVAGPHQLGGDTKLPATLPHSVVVAQNVPAGQTGLEDVEEAPPEEEFPPDERLPADDTGALVQHMLSGMP